MKIVIFGAAGQTGLELVKQALEKGHDVTAIVRNPDAMNNNKHERLHVTQGDATKPESFADTLNNQDAVLSAIGLTNFRGIMNPMTFHVDTIRNIVEQMKRQNVHRLICITSVGVVDNPTGPFFYKWIIHPLLRHIYEDMQHMEKVLSESNGDDNDGLKWTVVRPVRLVNGPQTGKYHVAEDGHIQKIGTISRADLAEFMLKQLESDELVCKAPAIGD